jgi:hypothetical protein
MYIIRRMRVRVWIAAIVCVLVAGSGCSNPLGKQYEYEEQVYLNTKGGATIRIYASIPALVALRGVPLDPRPTARVDQQAVKAIVEQSGCGDVRQVGQPWRKKNRWFIQVRIETNDVRTLPKCGMLSWSSYAYQRDEAGVHYEQTVAVPAAGDPGQVNWDGSELVAFRLYMPSRIVYHNVRRLDRDEPGTVGRGNILTWEQRLTDRRAGKPLHMDVRMESESILRRTMVLFSGAFAAAIVAIVLIVWWTIRRGRAQARRASA